jgi:hypothetical protein
MRLADATIERILNNDRFVLSIFALIDFQDKWHFLKMIATGSTPTKAANTMSWTVTVPTVHRNSSFFFLFYYFYYNQ